MEGGTSALSICAFCYRLNLFSVVVFYRCMVNWRRGALIDVHSAICHTDLVYWYSTDLWSLAGGGGQNLVGVVVYHISMITWREVIQGYTSSENMRMSR